MLMKYTRKLIRNSFLAFGQTSFVFGGSAVALILRTLKMLRFLTPLLIQSTEPEIR